MDDLIKALVKAGAPVLGTVIGGPVGTLAGAAIGALAEALGTSPTAEAVKEAIDTNPKAPAIVRQVEADKAPSLNADLEAILRDRQGAREQTLSLVNSGSAIAWGAPIVSVLVLFGFIALSWLAMNPSPGVRADVVLYLLGAWQTLAGGVVGYWVGSSSSSKDKDATLANLAKGVAR